jgi:ABC-2 type transport system ATP-binding protein
MRRNWPGLEPREAAVLKARNLVRKFGDLVAVDDVSFDVQAGKIFGLLGPNGAGKTTTISMVSGLLPPTEGSVEVDGIDLASHPRAVKERLGVVPQEIALYQELTARENLEFWGGIYDLRGGELRARVDELLGQVGLAERAREPVKNYSGGMKRRLNLAMGMIHQPRLLLLDEPTVGIDPQARIKILDIVRGVVKAGTAILYTTHYLEEAEDLCDELAIIDRGRILEQGTIAELKAHLGEGSLVTVQGAFKEAELREALRTLPRLLPLELTDGKAMLSVPRDGAGVGNVLESLFSMGVHFEDVTVKEPNLEDLFIKLTGRELRD